MILKNTCHNIKKDASKCQLNAFNDINREKGYKARSGK